MNNKTAQDSDHGSTNTSETPTTREHILELAHTFFNLENGVFILIIAWLKMAYASQFVIDDDVDQVCSLEEPSVDVCPLCVYQNDNIIQNINKVEASLVGKIENKQIYTILTDMYKKHVEPLKRQGKKLLQLDEKICEEHYTRHVVNATQQIAADILYCSKMQRHYQKNIAMRNNDNGSVLLNPQHVTEYVKISRHKLELIKHFSNAQRRKETAAQTAITPHAFN